MEPIGPIRLNSLGHIAPIGPVEPIGPIGMNSTYRANWAGGTNWSIWHHFVRTYLTNWARGKLIHIAPIGPVEPIGPIGINSLGHTATIGTVEPIGPIGINCSYRANWADGTNWPNWHQFNGTLHQLLPWNQVDQLA